VRFLNESGREVVGFDRSNIHIQVSAPEELVEKLVGFDIVVNVAAFTRVDDAETEIFEANSVNAIAAGKLAQA
jgi:dTDP-4-dehydrorhamnose reductase